MGDEELLPCPFCGGEADMQERYEGIWTAFCESCGVETGYPAACNEFTEAEAAEAWNTRVAAVPVTCEMEPTFIEPCAIEGKFQEWECSECGEFTYLDVVEQGERPNFCQHCGARNGKAVGA